MIMYKSFSCLIALFVIVKCDQIYDMMYRHIENRHFSSCIRRFNGTHQVGCSTHFNGNIGKLIGIKNKGDLFSLLEMHIEEDIMILFYNTAFYNATALKQIKDSKLPIKGIFIFNNFNATEKSFYSPDNSCPLSSSELYKGDPKYGDCRQGKWNPRGNDLLNQDLGYPVTLLFNATDADFLYDHCFVSINSKSGNEKTCKVQVKSIMFGAVNTQTCMRRSTSFIDQNDDYCIPLGGLNVHNFLYPPVNVTNDSMILVMTHMDSRSMFSSLSPGGHSALTGVVPLLLVAKAMAAIKQRNASSVLPKRNVLFSFLNGESFDYIGSGRMVYDIKNGDFPASRHFSRLNLSAFHSIVELNQLSGRQVYVHSDARAIGTDQQLKKKMESLWAAFDARNSSDNVTWHVHVTRRPLPPSSVQSFLKHTDIPAIVITDHHKQYANRYYNSHLDGLDVVDDLDQLSKTLTDVAQRLVDYLASELYGTSPSNIIAIDRSLTLEMLNCFLVNSTCSLLNDTLDGTVDIADTVNAGQSSLLESFVGTMYAESDEVERYANIGPLTYVIKRLLANYTGSLYSEVNDRKSCTQLSDDSYVYVWIQGPLANGTRQPFCSRSLANYSVALSPAFVIKDYKWESGEYSTWSESFEGKHSIRVFVNVSSYTEMLYLLMSFPYFAVFLIVVIFIYFKSEYIFDVNLSNSQSTISTNQNTVST